jgi:hypothetical protein
LFEIQNIEMSTQDPEFLLVYPNPHEQNEHYTISFNSDSINNRLLIISNLTGQLINQYNIPAIIDEITVSNNLASGIYMVSILNSSGRTISTKMVVK